MFIDILEQPEVAFMIDLVTMLGFIIALVFAYKNCRDNPSVFILASILVANFVIANNALYSMILGPSEPDGNYYLRWVQYDSLTIIATIVIHLITRIEHHKLTKTAMYLLMVNIAVYMSMHIDIIVNGNREPWMLWTLYTPIVHLIELSISASIIGYFLYSKKEKELVA